MSAQGCFKVPDHSRLHERDDTAQYDGVSANCRATCHDAQVLQLRILNTTDSSGTLVGEPAQLMLGMLVQIALGASSNVGSVRHRLFR